MIQKEKLFFTSIPKAGKNVIQSFLFKLGYLRLDLKEGIARELVAQRTYLNYFPDLSKRATYALPAINAQDIGKIENSYQLLLQKMHTMPARSFIHHHFAFDKELHREIRKQGIPIVFLYRDPRDVLLSMANYFISQREPEHLIPKFTGLSIEDIMILLLRGDNELIPFASYMKSFTGWLSADSVLKIRFEDIIGPKGNGTLEDQQNAFNVHAGTFFKGKIGAWKEGFSATVMEAFNENAEDLLKEWKYL